MARLQRLVPTGKVFFVTTNLRRGLPAFSPRERDALCKIIATVRARRRFRLPGYVLMPDHLHLLLLPAAEDTLAAVVQELKFVSGRTINKRRGTRGALWQKGFFDRFMRTAKEFLETLTYLHQNPVRKNLVPAADGWRWSSASAYTGSAGLIAIDFLDLPAEAEKRLW